MTETVGRFHYDRPLWRVATGEERTATAVQQLLGGEVHDRFPDRLRWHVGTAIARVEILTEEVDTEAMTFRLAERSDLGSWVLHAKGWSLEEVVQGAPLLAAVDGPLRLSLVWAEITTRMGRHIRYTRPMVEAIG